MPSTTISRGNALSTFYIQPSLTPASVTASTTAVQTFNVPGLLTSDLIAPLGLVGSQIAGVTIVECDCITAGVLSIQFGNFTAAGVVPTAGLYTFQIIRPEGSLPATAV